MGQIYNGTQRVCVWGGGGVGGWGVGGWNVWVCVCHSYLWMTHSNFGQFLLPSQDPSADPQEGVSRRSESTRRWRDKADDSDITHSEPLSDIPSDPPPDIPSDTSADIPSGPLPTSPSGAGRFCTVFVGNWSDGTPSTPSPERVLSHSVVFGRTELLSSDVSDTCGRHNFKPRSL